MPSLPVLSGKELVRLLAREDFEIVPRRGKGSHMVMIHKDRGLVITIPDHRELDRGTLRAIIRQAGVTREDLDRLVRED